MSRLVDVFPQRVYGSVPLLLPLIKMSDAEGIQLEGQPQIYEKDYPLDYSGLNFSPPWWADTGVGGGLNGVGGGNVRLMPWEMGLTGFRGLGVTKAQAAAAARKTTVAAAKASGATAAAAAKAGAAAATAARQTYVAPPKAAPAAAASITSQPASNTVSPLVATNSSGLTAAQQKKMNTCTTKGGTWNPSSLTCTLPLTATQQNTANKKTCTTGGGVWDNKNKVCNPGSAQAACTAAGDTWANGQCTPSPAHTACLATNPPGSWAAGVCTPAAAATTPTTPTGTTCPTAVTSCAAGLIIGTDANGCTVCVTDPNYATNQQQAAMQAAMLQCQQSGGYWNGSYCGAPPGASSYAPSGGGGGDVSPIPPGFDPTGGTGGDPYGGSGGGMPMTQSQGGPGPQLNDQASQIPMGDDSSNYDPTTDPSQTGDQSDGSNTDDGSTDDTSKVAGTSIFDSISKLFSGMGSLQCGCNAPPPWFGMGGGNAPILKVAPVAPSYYTSPGANPLKPSTTVAVVGAAVTLIVGAAAVFLWTKGNKK